MASPYLGQLLNESIADHIGATPLVQLNRPFLLRLGLKP